MSAKISLPLRDFQSALKRVALACSDDDARPVLQRVQVIASPARVRLQTADGFRLHRVDIWDDHGTFADYEDIALPIVTLLDPDQIKYVNKYKIPRKSDPRLIIDPDAGHLLIDGKPTPGALDPESRFPDVDQLFPKQAAIKVKVKSAELLAAVKTARIYSREGSNVVRLHVSDQIVVHAISEELGESYNVVTPEHLNRVSVHDIVIAFNADYLIDYLKTAGESVRIDLWKPTQPAIFYDGAGSEFTGLIMPMYIDKRTELITPADIPTPAPSDYVSGYNDAGVWIRDPRDVEYTTAQDAWNASHTVTHDPEFGIHGAYIPDDIFHSEPNPGAVITELDSVFAYHVEPDNGRGKGLGVTILHLANPQPDPSAPIPADGWPQPNRHPLIDSKSITVGECSRCTDPDHHALVDGLCKACRLEIAELQAA